MAYKTARIIFAISLVLVLSSQAFASTSAEVINNFALNAARIIGETEGVYFFSPFSIMSAFGMAYAGASGETAAEIERALGFDWELHGKLGEFVQDIIGTEQFSSANRIWLNKGLELRKEYQDNLYLYYRSKATELDIENDSEASRTKINDWVSEQTNGKIQNLLQQLDPATRMIITNAVYFNAEWQKKFPKDNTETERFTDGEKVSGVSMMKQTSRFDYGEFDGIKIIRLPYKGRRLSMIAVLPPEENPDALYFVDMDTLKHWIASITEHRVDLWLPKFKTEMRCELSDLFKTLGVTQAFSNSADFSGISKSENLKIDAVIHQTFIDVDEEKTEAAAATAITMVRATSMPNPVPLAEFHADRPFMYFIFDDATGTILFMGRQTF